MLLLYLIGDKLVINSVLLRHQLVMETALDNLAVTKTEDNVSVFDGGQSVRNDDGCATKASL